MVEFRPKSKACLLGFISLLGIATNAASSLETLRILSYQSNNGYEHASMPNAKALLEKLGHINGWEVVSFKEPGSLAKVDLNSFDTVIFNNNCGNKGPVMTSENHEALRGYMQQGGGFLGIHTAGALWKEGGEFQSWYEGLIGARQVRHPKVQQARLVVEDRTHPATMHLPEEWFVTDEWHIFDRNPRDMVNVLISLDEDSYEGKPNQKMGGDHPFVWYHEYDGGRSFFTSLGHTPEIYSNPAFEKLIEGAVLWTSGRTLVRAEKDAMATSADLPVTEGLCLDLNANFGVETEDGHCVKAWRNQIAGTAADVFVKQDEGRKEAGSGRPTLKTNVPAIGNNSALIFEEQELINMDEDAFDHLVTGSGYTWFSVMCVYPQHIGKKDVNSFFGNLRNGPPYDGFWGNLMDDNRVWMGTRNGLPMKKRALWDEKTNPLVVSPAPLEEHHYYVISGRMGAGQKVVDLELFINAADPVDRKSVPVNPEANPSKLAIGQERDAVNHPGKESFHGELSRFLIYERPLSDAELKTMIPYLMKKYSIQESK